jgi:chemotaxis protein MotB
VTFADLMSLLMCFFVLLLSFSEMDVSKYKRLAGSMKEAFGVQNKLNVADIPKGTSIIAQEFSPGRPDPTPLNEVWQHTSDVTKASLEVACQDLGSSNAGERGDAQRLVVVDKVADLVGETEQEAIELATALSKEIAAGVLEVETMGRKIIIRVKEHGSFPSGSASLTRDFAPVLKIIRGVLKNTQGQIYVEGHTDNVPISTAAFRSNWALSSARAVSVAHGLFQDGAMDENRFTVTGYASTRPLASNDTAEGRTRNRRVEVVIQQGLDDDVKKELDDLRTSDPVSYQKARSELMQRFDLRPDEIF